MKHFKKFFSYLVALTMVLSLAAFTGTKVNAQTGNYSIKLTNGGKTAHTFTIYQVFTGDVANDGSLSNIKWGNGIKEEDKSTLGDAATKAETLAKSETKDADARAFAESLQGHVNVTNGTTQTVAAGGEETVSLTEAGYYLIQDQIKNDGKSNQDGQKEGATTLYMLKVVGRDTEANAKLDVPSVYKKVKDVNDSVANSTTEWQDSADYDIGDTIPYQLTGTLPSNYDKYDTYSYKFTDEMSAGLTYVNNSVKVYKKFGNTVSPIDSKEYTAKWKNQILTVEFSNLKNVTSNAADQIIVEYNATLNEHAVVGSKGNPNEVYLTYSNNPNAGGTGQTGYTPKDKNIVFTYKTVVNKVDQDEQPLAGAGFTLQKKVKKDDGTFGYQDVKKIEAGENTTSFTFEGLDDGDYQLIESTTPAGYNTIAPIEFKIEATHDETADDPKLLTLTGNKADGSTFLKTITEKKDNKDVPTGELTASVKNQKGSTLPSTGGMGTTLLYVAGGILVACAAAYVVMSRKHSTNK